MNNKNLLTKGIGASSGIAFAKVFLIKKPKFEINESLIEDESAEVAKVENAIAKASAEIKKIKEIAVAKIGIEKATVFEGHVQIANDPELMNQILELVRVKKFNGAYAINEVFEQTRNLFANMDDEYFRQRASDIIDVKEKILAYFLNVDLPDILSIDQKVIIVAHDLTPSETALLDKNFVKGFATDIGGRTSHAAIMAQTMEIPAVLGLKNITDQVDNNDVIAIDGEKGEVEINPTDLNVWHQKQETYLKEKEELKKFIFVIPKTLDNHTVDVVANIGKPADVDIVDSYGANGVGLVRTEFLYMDNSNWPTEDVQFEAYKYILSKQKDKLVIIRTLDIGGDKKLSYYRFNEELNPFLGFRAIRFCLQNPQIFKTQIRALLRASAFGRLGIMFPMIATVDEFLAAKKVVEETKAELKAASIEYADNVLIGMMVEIPASAFLADTFAKYADFFSIGTNDLIQYTLAVDRMSENVGYLYQPNNPSVLRAIKATVLGAKRYNRFVGMCGEMAGDINSIPLLLGIGGYGLDELSMSPSSIPRAKKLICSLKKADCIALANQALTCNTESEVNNLVKVFLKNKI
ncbi:MAG: phosphoenolpyruvate--protein phosphotransferase [Malacoplasma sp.]|nr:phosphoenolpyruvate--protein phosphotransferase [Malacoplasma sp.]